MAVFLFRCAYCNLKTGRRVTGTFAWSFLLDINGKSKEKTRFKNQREKRAA